MPTLWDINTDDKDLIYEGIATSTLYSLCSTFKDDKDLIYEGIATFFIALFSVFCFGGTTKT